jgi:hypothetical protein
MKTIIVLTRSNLPLEGGGRPPKLQAKAGGWGSFVQSKMNPLPNPPPFRGREHALLRGIIP